ncbi:MAG TPA: AsnC family transcriptional regulator [Hyphomicrobiales bacterium]|nr:AsnC family transcriptional regulator [Kaistiaceae bacterium]HQF31736.1 AsnC family transcriptional regulator [Hyphomicrobiales bacterium]
MRPAAAEKVELDEVDRRIVNDLQGGLPLEARPFAIVGERLGISEGELIRRLRRLLDGGALTRFGPLYNADRMGGAFTLSAMAVPAERFEEVAAIVNSFVEVAHNYERDHALNMWFVIGCEDAARVGAVIAEIEAATGLAVHDFPKEEEYFVEFKVTV